MPEAADHSGDRRRREAPPRGRRVVRQRDPPGSEAGQCAAGRRMAGQGGRLRDSKIARRWSYRNSDKDRHTVRKITAVGLSSNQLALSSVLYISSTNIYIIVSFSSYWELTLFLNVMVPSGYMAPEYVQSDGGETTLKCDVYSFGVTLMETLSGRKNCDTPSLVSEVKTILNCLGRSRC